MDQGTWETVIQAGILAFCTWYMRRGSKKDSALTIRSTAAQSTSNEILDRVKSLETDLALVKKIALSQTEIDHRSPKGE